MFASTCQPPPPLLSGACAIGLNGINAFGECTNLTSFGQPFMSSMFECADNVATLSYYTDDSCSTVLSSNETANNTCIGGQIERCSSEGERENRSDETCCR